MPTKSYYTVNGVIIGQRTGGARVNFLTDALGSVTATTSSSGTVVNRYRFKPYGSLLSESGAGADPAFQWVGSLGYRSFQESKLNYMRSRHYIGTLGAFTSQAPAFGRLFYGEKNYAYANSNPINYLDPTGRLPAISTCQTASCCCCPAFLRIGKMRIVKFKSFHGEQGERFGHDFEIEWGVTYMAHKGAFADCKVCFKEMSPSGLYQGEAKKWVDRFHREEFRHHFAPWYSRKKDCQASDLGEFWDEPSVLKSRMYPSGGSRFLYIQVVIKGAPDCPCEPKELHLNIQQILFYDPQKRRSPDGWVGLLTPPERDPGNLPAVVPPWESPSSC